MSKPTEPKNAPVELAPRYWIAPEWLELSHEERLNFTNAAAIRHATGKWPAYAAHERKADHEAAYKALVNVVKPVANHREDEE
jgi:hypothetical protein